jgi:NADH-quinone oxidoreductase subunit L
MHHEQDMRRMGGLKKYHADYLAHDVCRLAGDLRVPIFAGFFSKDEILWKTWSGHIPGVSPNFGKALWFIGAVTALLTPCT